MFRPRRCWKSLVSSIRANCCTDSPVLSSSYRGNPPQIYRNRQNLSDPIPHCSTRPSRRAACRKHHPDCSPKSPARYFKHPTHSSKTYNTELNCPFLSNLAGASRTNPNSLHTPTHCGASPAIYREHPNPRHKSPTRGYPVSPKTSPN